MRKAIGIFFTVFVAVAASFAFSPRPMPPMPPTETRIGHLVMLDAQALDGRVVAVGERGHVFVSDDTGVSWRGVASPTEATLTALAAVDAARLVAVGHDAVILHSGDRGERWSVVYEAPEERRPLLAVWFDGAGHGFAVGAYGHFLESRDGGLSWEAREIDDAELHFNAITRAADGTLLIAGEAGTLLRSSDGGESWERLDSPYEGSLFGLLALPDGAVLAFGMRGHVLRTEDGGESWVELDSGVQASIFGGRRLADGTVLLAGQNGVLLASGDGGRTFAEQVLPERRSHTALLGTGRGAEVLLVGEQGYLRGTLRVEDGRR